MEFVCPDAPQAGSSDDADSIAANAVYDAAVGMHADDVAAFDAALAADVAARAMLDVRCRLDNMGVVGPAATFLLATSVDGLLSVATECWVMASQMPPGMRCFRLGVRLSSLVTMSCCCVAAPCPPLLFGIPVLGGVPPILTIVALVRSPLGSFQFLSKRSPLGYSSLVTPLGPPSRSPPTTFWRPPPLRNATAPPQYPTLLWFRVWLDTKSWK